MKKHTVVFFALVTSILILSLLTYKALPLENYLEISFCDVGQGDATLVEVGFIQILIDVGKNDAVITCLENHMPFWDKRIEILVLTHRDSDHIGGLTYVLDYYSFKYIFINPSNKKTSVFELLERFSPGEGEFQTKVITVFSGTVVYLANFGKLEILWPDPLFFEKKSPDSHETETTLSDTLLELSNNNLIENNENNLSIAIKLTFGDVVILMPGDLEESVELAMSTGSLLNKVDILKAGHHGSKTSSTRLFLDKIRPERIVVSSGKNNPYGHPHKEVLDRFADVNAQVFLTSTSGTVSFVSDGRTIWENGSR